jgi:molybdopterin synthase catalytic subunit
MSVLLLSTDFDPPLELKKFTDMNNQSGAINSFMGRVRSESDRVQSLFIEHYPGMTEKVISSLENEARQKWSLHDSRIFHRYGEVKAGEVIVFILVASAHRKDSFAACEFLIDRLKSDAPFWKKEIGKNHSLWVVAKQEDQDRNDRWLQQDQGLM